MMKYSPYCSPSARCFSIHLLFLTSRWKISPSYGSEPLWTKGGRELVYRSDHDRATLMRRAAQEAREIRKARAGKLPIYKNPGEHCNFCPFREMCEVHESGSDWQAMRRALYTKWAPYEIHDAEVRV